jgi:hypothetical protein
MHGQTNIKCNQATSSLKQLMDLLNKITIKVPSKIRFKSRDVSMVQALKIKLFGSAGNKPEALLCVIMNYEWRKELRAFVKDDSSPN